jgi:hypothetical protein
MAGFLYGFPKLARFSSSSFDKNSTRSFAAGSNKLIIAPQAKAYLAMSPNKALNQRALPDSIEQLLWLLMQCGGLYISTVEHHMF